MVALSEFNTESRDDMAAANKATMESPTNPTVKIVDLASLKRDPTLVLAVLDRFIERNVMADEGERVSLALVIEHRGIHGL